MTATTATSTAPSVAAAVAYARAQIGKPYVWAATGPNGFDCSGLVLASWRAGGYTLGRTSQMMAADPRLTTVTQAQLQPGDLVFPDLGHVQIFTGPGQVIESPRSGLTVRETGMSGFLTGKRIPGATGASTVTSSGGTATNASTGTAQNAGLLGSVAGDLWDAIRPALVYGGVVAAGVVLVIIGTVVTVAPAVKSAAQTAAPIVAGAAP